MLYKTIIFNFSSSSFHKNSHRPCLSLLLERSDSYFFRPQFKEKWEERENFFCVDTNAFEKLNCVYH